jgi:hypothetical protein
MHSRMNLAVLALAGLTVIPALSAPIPIQYRYGILLVRFKA